MLGWLISQDVFITNIKGINIDIDFIGIKRISKNNYIFLFWIKNYNDQGHLYFNNNTITKFSLVNKDVDLSEYIQDDAFFNYFFKNIADFINKKITDDAFHNRRLYKYLEVNLEIDLKDLCKDLTKNWYDSSINCDNYWS